MLKSKFRAYEAANGRAPDLTFRFRDVKLLSFGGEEEAEEEPVVFKKKPIVRPDCESAACFPTFAQVIELNAS